MSIEFDCSHCGRRVKGPENLSGQMVKCPHCQGVITVPEAVYEAEEIPSAIRSSPSPAPAYGGFQEAPYEAGGSDEPRRPCPLCGEMIRTSAIKCRFCGEIFDPTFRKGTRGGLPLASLGARLGAALLDGFFAMLAYLPGYALIAADGAKNDKTAAVGLSLLVFSFVVLLVIQVSMLASSGQTLGKKIVGIRIVRYDNEDNPGFVVACLLRSLVPGLIGAVPCIGPIFSIVDILCIFGEERRCLHDQIAGTKVINA